MGIQTFDSTKIREDLENGLKVINQDVGVYTGYLTPNSKWPYMDIPVTVKSGEWLYTRVKTYSGTESNVDIYLYDVATSTNLHGGIQVDVDDFWKSTLDLDGVRIIFKHTNAPTAPIYVTVEMFVYGDGSLLDVARNRFAYEYEISATPGSNIIITSIPFYADNGDVLELEVVDNDGILNSNYVASIGYMNGSTRIDDVLQIVSPYTKGVAKIATDINPNSLVFFMYSTYIASSGTFTIRYKNATKMGLPPRAKHYTSFSVLGDSYSTFLGYTNPLANSQWYPTDDATTQGYNTGNDVTELEQMWWYMLADSTELYLNENASYSGSTICYDSYGSGTADGKEHSFIQRVNDLEKSSLLFIFGGTNDNWAGASIGSYKYSNWTESDLSYFAPAVAYLIDDIKKKYVGMDIVFIENDSLSNEFKTAIETVCAHYYVPVIKLNSVSKTHSHPNTSGMVQIFKQVRHYLMLDSNVYPYYE